MREYPHDGGKLPLEIDKALSQQEIESGVQAGLAHLSGKEARKPEDHFHNTKHLLKQYRRVLYSVSISEEDLNLRVEMEHGSQCRLLLQGCLVGSFQGHPLWH